MGTLTDGYIEGVLKFFKGNEEFIAIQPAGKKFRPQKLVSPLTVDEFREQHLSGNNCIGFYPITLNNEVYAACVDFDSHPDNPDPAWVEKTEQLSFLLLELEIENYVEVSASGIGSHVWIFFNKATEAWLPRAFFSFIAQHLGTSFTEIYPRQDRITAKKLCNLIRMPHYGDSRFVDIEEEWETIYPVFKGIDPEELKVVAARLGYRLEPQTAVNTEMDISPHVYHLIQSKPNSLLARRWNGDLEDLKDRSQSACVQSLVNCMVEAWIHPDDIDEALQQWGRNHNYAKCERDDFRHGTINKAYQYKQRPKNKPDTQRGNFMQCAAAALEKAGVGNYIGFGIPCLDASIDGVAPGEMALVMARPGHGKSALGAQWLEHAAKTGRPALMLNAEMSADEQGRRNLMKITGQDEQSWAENRQEVAQLLQEYYKDFDPPHFRNVSTIEDCEREVEAFKIAYGIDCVVIDYVQLIRSSKSSRYESVTDVSQRLKILAREQNVAMVCLAQASREVERRPTVEFLPSDLKESGSLEQDADLIFGIWWWGRARDPGNANPNCAEVQILKRRNGPIRESRLRLLFDAPKQTFSDW